MNKLLILGLFLLLFIYGCSDDLGYPEEKIKPLLPSSWELNVSENTAPLLWEGKEKCKLISIVNPYEIYTEPLLGFNYTARHSFWFCPKDWVTEQPEIQPVLQIYPATLICDCNEYKIFHLSQGENSLKELPILVKEEFSK